MRDLYLILQDYMYHIENNMEIERCQAINLLKETSDNLELLNLIELNIPHDTITEIFRDLRVICRYIARPPNSSP